MSETKKCVRCGKPLIRAPHGLDCPCPIPNEQYQAVKATYIAEIQALKNEIANLEFFRRKVFESLGSSKGVPPWDLIVALKSELATLQNIVALTGWRVLTPETEWVHGLQVGGWFDGAFLTYAWNWNSVSAKQWMHDGYSHYRHSNPPAQKEASNG